ncbi:DUF1479 domain-containing protein [uncultured Friedmanniella sp.]|uniref:DUF1479 domain-containing protein n=1 Tax=uncultured Friedmanniella sp. TaxID=335381 RepID=UPI0035CC16EC
MTSTTTGTARSELTGLPHWETQPDDLAAATREIKHALRERIAASGRTVGDVVAEVEDFLRAEIADILTTRARGEEVWPVVDYADIEAGTVSEETLALVQRRGCVVVRGHFERKQAEQWDRQIVDYVDGNHFFEHYAGPADDFFGDLDAGKPEIYPVYWSCAQMEARQHPRMARVQSFLNARWTSASEGRRWFDPERDSLYPDRIRRRPPGADSGGLGTHLDPGTLDLWMTEGYQQTFRHLFAGDFAAYDPWDASYRTEAAQFPGSTMCSAFRTFQGWTALSEMPSDQGVLHTVPIPKAMAYLMLRPLLDDVPEDSMCGVKPNHTFPVTEEWHALLMDAVSGIPSVQPGDSVWWHCDLVHAVAPVTDQQGWGNVMYIPAAPWCPKNEQYAGLVRDAFLAGRSPYDFPEEHYEVAWPDRFAPDQLNAIGRRGLGL